MHGSHKNRLRYFRILSKKPLSIQKKILCKNNKIIDDFKNISNEVLYNKVFNKKSNNKIFTSQQLRILKKNKGLIRKIARAKTADSVKNFIRKGLKGGFLSLIPPILAALITALT